MSQNVVCEANVLRYYGDKPELLDKYARIAESGNCPFCAPNIQNEFVGTTIHWSIVKNQFPYKGSRSHLLILPARHVIDVSELLLPEWIDFPRAIEMAVRMNSFMQNGYGLALRVKEVGGVTLNHLHWHLITPQIGEKGQIPVNFGIG